MSFVSLSRSSRRIFSDLAPFRFFKFVDTKLEKRFAQPS